MAATTDEKGSEMVDAGELNRRDSASSTKSHLADVDEIRLQISKLQEQKAEALKRQVVELQKEKDMAIGRTKIMQSTLEGLTLELANLKEAKDKVNTKAVQLERNLFEEQLHSSELKRKLQLANKQIAHLKSEVKSMKNRLAGNSSSLLQGSLDMDSSTEENQSLSSSVDDFQKQSTEKEEQERQLPSHAVAAAKRDVSLVTSNTMTSPLVHSQVASVSKSSPNSSSATSSPSMAPKRYKLSSSEALKPASVQTEASWPEEYVDKTTLDGMRSNYETEKAALEKKIQILTSEIQSSSKEYRAKLNKKIKEIRTEQKILMTGLADFRAWAKTSLQNLEDDIDTCKVVYSLHGSMSQEAELIRDLQEKLQKCEQKKKDAEALSKYLKENIETIESQLKHSKKQNGLLKEKILLLAPLKSSKQSFYSRTTSSDHHHTTVGSPQAVRSSLAPPTMLRLASTPQTTRSTHASSTHQNIGNIPSNKLKPEHLAATNHEQKRKNQLPQGRTAGGHAVGKINRYKTDAEDVKSNQSQRAVAEKLVMDGEKWYTVPDDDDESEV